MSRPKRALRLAALSFALLVGTASAARAQDFDRVVPRLPPENAPPVVPPPPGDEAPSQDQTVLIPELRAVRFVASPEAVQTGGVAPEMVVGGVDAPELPLLSRPEFVGQIRPFLGRPLTRAELGAITQAVQLAYRDSDRPFMFVSVPEQNVQNGVIQILVTEFRIGEVSVTGNRHFSTRRILSMGDLDPGETLTLPRLRKALDDYNQNPFLSVNALTEPGAETGTTNIILQASDRAPWRVYAGVDNQGVPTLGRWEWYVGFNWGNVFGTGQILSYQYTRSFEGSYESHSLSDVIPVGPDDRILLFGAYSTQEPDLGPIFDSEGHSAQVSGRWVHDLPYSIGFQHSIQVGVDYKRADSNLEFFGFRVLDTDVEVFQFPIVYTARIPNRRGLTVIENLLVISPGDITANNTDEDLQQLVPFADATYIYDRISVTHTFNLAEEMSLVLRAMGQLASGNLPYSEQIGGGGLGSVRGYDTNSVLGSEGVLLTAEWRSPPFSPIGSIPGVPGERDFLQFSVFTDYGYFSQPDRFPDLPRSEELASLGVGVNYAIGRYLDIEASVAHQLNRPRLRFDRETRADLVVTISF